MNLNTSKSKTIKMVFLTCEGRTENESIGFFLYALFNKNKTLHKNTNKKHEQICIWRQCSFCRVECVSKMVCRVEKCIGWPNNFIFFQNVFPQTSVLAYAESALSFFLDYVIILIQTSSVKENLKFAFHKYTRYNICKRKKKKLNYILIVWHAKLTYIYHHVLCWFTTS